MDNKEAEVSFNSSDEYLNELTFPQIFRLEDAVDAGARPVARTAL